MYELKSDSTVQQFLRQLLCSSQNWPHGCWHSTIDDALQFLTDFQEVSLEFQTISLQLHYITLQ